MPSFTQDNVFLSKPFTVKEVSDVIKGLKSGKAGGVDSTVPELFKY